MISPVAQVVKNLPVMQEVEEIRVQSLGWEDTLEEEMATHSSFLVWKIPQTEEPGGLQSIESQRVRQDLVTEYAHTCLDLFLFGPPTLSAYSTFVVIVAV